MVNFDGSCQPMISSGLGSSTSLFLGKRQDCCNSNKNRCNKCCKVAVHAKVKTDTLKLLKSSRWFFFRKSPELRKYSCQLSWWLSQLNISCFQAVLVFWFHLVGYHLLGCSHPGSILTSKRS